MGRRRKPVPDKVRCTAQFNNKKTVAPTEDADVLHVAPQLFQIGILQYQDVVKLAENMNVLMHDKTFTANERSYTIVKVFHAGRGIVRMRCEIGALSEISKTSQQST